MTGRTAGALLDRVLITGGAGLIGSHIADELVRRRRARDRRSSTTSRAARRENLPRGVRERPGADHRGRRSRSRRRSIGAMEGVDAGLPSRRRSASRSAPRSRASPMDVLVDGTFNVLEAAVAGRRSQGRRRVVRVGLRTGRGVSDRRAPSSVRATARSTARPRSSTKGCCAASTSMYGLDYVALRYFNVYGPRMDVLRRLHRSADPLDGGDRRRAAADDLRRRQRDDGLRARRRHRARQHAGGRVAGDRRGLQHRQRRRDLAERARGACCCRSWVRRCGRNTSRRAR